MPQADQSVGPGVALSMAGSANPFRMMLRPSRIGSSHGFAPMPEVSPV